MKRMLSLVLVLALVVCLSACTAKGNSGATTTAPTTGTTTAPAIPMTSLNAFTGEEDMTGDSNRPVAIMVTNEKGIIGNQYGIDKPDMYMETEAEGAVPRIMAIFASANRVPEKFGPVRSARTPFIATANALGCVYVYSGATTYVRQKMESMSGFDRITNTDSKTLWRDSYLTSHANVSWNNLITGGQQLSDKISASKYSLNATKKTPFTFGEKAGDTVANKVQLKSTASTTVTFIYDEATGLYGKNIGKASSCTPHKSQEGNQIQVSNVLILYAEKYVENKNTEKTWYNFRTGEGTGYLISNGTAREIKFNRTEDSLSFTEADGSPAVFATGKTYMFLTDKTLASDLSFS